MHRPKFGAAALAAVAASFVTGCASKFPTSPVPSALTDREAHALVSARLYERDAGAPRTISSIQRTGSGYLIAYRDDFEIADKPPRPVRLVEVGYDGGVREVQFTRGQ